MKIRVTAIHRESFAGVWTPQTLWPSTAPTDIEVIDADESPKRDPGQALAGMKIGRSELATLRKTAGLVVSGMDQSNAVEMTAQLAEAHAAHAVIVAELKAQMAQQTAEILRLKPFEAQCVEQEQLIASLRASAIVKQGQSKQGQPQQQAAR